MYLYLLFISQCTINYIYVNRYLLSFNLFMYLYLNLNHSLSLSLSLYIYIYIYICIYIYIYFTRFFSLKYYFHIIVFYCTFLLRLLLLFLLPDPSLHFYRLVFLFFLYL